MTTPTEAPREALPEPLEVVAWKSPMWRFYPTRFNAVQNGEQLLDALVRLTDAQSALESERQAHAAEVERLRGDAERLDWIVRQADEFSCSMIVDAPGDGEYIVHGMDGYGQGKTPREAIDNAMRFNAAAAIRSGGEAGS